jgi:hypothetical protein
MALLETWVTEWNRDTKHSGSTTDIKQRNEKIKVVQENGNNIRRLYLESNEMNKLKTSQV